MSAKIEIRELQPAEYEAWERVVAGAPGGSVYALPRYLEVLCAVTDARFRVVAGLRGGEILGGIALYELRSVLGTLVAPRALLSYNGPVFAAPRSKYPSENTSLHLKLVGALDDWLARRNYGYVCLKSRGDLTDVRPFEARGWSTSPAYTYEVSLTDLQSAFSRVEGNFRRLVRRCEREGFRLVSDEDFDTFFQMHIATHERKATPIYLPRTRFRTYFERLRERGLCRLYHARLPDDTTAASQLVLTSAHPVAHTVCAGTTAEHLSSGASVFLRWKALEALTADGFAGNDMTGAPLGNVTRFKSRFGGDLRLSLVVARPSARWRLREQALAPARFARSVVRHAAQRITGRRRRTAA